MNQHPLRAGDGVFAVIYFVSLYTAGQRRRCHPHGVSAESVIAVIPAAEAGIF